MKQYYLRIGKHKINITKDLEQGLKTVSIPLDECFNPVFHEQSTKIITEKSEILERMVFDMAVDVVDEEEDLFGTSKIFTGIETEEAIDTKIKHKKYLLPCHRYGLGD